MISARIQTSAIRRVAVFMMLAAMLASCATFNHMVTNNALVSELAVKAATARTLHDHPAWKGQTVDITGKAMAAVDSKTVASLAQVTTYVKGLVPWNKMLPEEQALVSTLMDQVTRNLEDSFRTQGVANPEAQMVAVRDVLQWINDQAKLAT